MQFSKSSFKNKNEFDNFFCARGGRKQSLRQIILNMKPHAEVVTVKMDSKNEEFRLDLPYSEAKKRGLKIVTRRVRYTDGRPKAIVVGTIQSKK